MICLDLDFTQLQNKIAIDKIHLLLPLSYFLDCFVICKKNTQYWSSHWISNIQKTKKNKFFDSLEHLLKCMHIVQAIKNYFSLPFNLQRKLPKYTTILHGVVHLR